MYYSRFPGWLDDIGLPQYKDSFSDGSVDGRMLNYLTFVSSKDLSPSKEFYFNNSWTFVLNQLIFH